MKKPPPNPYDDAKELVKPSFPSNAFRVFVLGPGLNPNAVVRKPSGTPKDHDSVVEHARYLRYATKLALTKAGYPVDFGESAEMLHFWQEQFGSQDPGSSELLQADRMSGAIIVYPSSAGSLCELGMFAPTKFISEKILAIVHAKYEHDDSFFRKALLEVLEQENGKYRFHDYSDHERCVAEALKFVIGKYQSFLREDRIISYAETLKLKRKGTFFDGNR